MAGIELRENELLVDRTPSELDALAIEFSSILEELDVRHVYVAGYVAILAGRPRATQDIDVLSLCEERIPPLTARVNPTTPTLTTVDGKPDIPR